MAGLFDMFLDAYTAPNQRAQEQFEFERDAPQRTADKWNQVQAQMEELRNPKPDLTSVEKYDPLTNPTSSIQMPQEKRKLSQDELYKARISAYISSGDPVLQKQGISMLPEYYKSQAPNGVSHTNEYKNYLAATRPEDRSPEHFQQWLDNKRANSGIHINTGVKSRVGTPLTRDEKIRDKLDPEATYYHTNSGPKAIGTSAQSDENKASNVAKNSINQMNKQLFGDGGLFKNRVDDSGVPAALKRVVKGNFDYFTRDDERVGIFEDYTETVISNLARSLGGEKGTLSNEDVARIKVMLPTMIGLRPDTKESAQAKMRQLEILEAVSSARGGFTKEELNQYIDELGYAEEVKDEPKYEEGSYEDLLSKGWRDTP